MDVDTKDALDALRTEIQTVDERLTTVDEGVRAVDERLTAVEKNLRQEIREEAITTRRHFDVVAESVRDDIRLIAEGLVALDAKVDGMRRT